LLTPVRLRLQLEAQTTYGEQLSTALFGCFLGAVVFAALRLRVFPPIFGYLSTSCDVLLLTAVAAMGERAESELVVGFFVIVAASYLRYRFRLVAFTAVIATLGYLTLAYNTPQFRVRPTGVPFPYASVLRVIAGLSVMTLIGWQLQRKVAIVD
jgi:hypothetical protein